MGGEASAARPRRPRPDRRPWYAVVDGDGRFATAKDSRRFRRRDEVFAYAATTAPTAPSRSAATTTPGGSATPTSTPSCQRRFGDPVRVLRSTARRTTTRRPVSLVGTATLAWCARELGVDADPRRLRVNLLLETDEPFVEEGWLGRTLDDRGRPAPGRRTHRALSHHRPRPGRRRHHHAVAEGARRQPRALRRHVRGSSAPGRSPSATPSPLTADCVHSHGPPSVEESGPVDGRQRSVEKPARIGRKPLFPGDSSCARLCRGHRTLPTHFLREERDRPEVKVHTAGQPAAVAG